MNSTAAKLTIGIDVGDKASVVCVLDEAGNVAERAKVATTKAGYKGFFAKRDPARIALEAGTHSGWITHALMKFGHDVIVANARSLELLTKSHKKNDENDAELLARIARADPKLLSPVQLRAPELNADLAVIRARDGLVRARTKLVNCVRGIVKSTGEKLPSCSTESFHKRVAASVPKELLPAVKGLLTAIGQLSKQIRESDKRIKELAKKYPECERIEQIAGVASLTALAFMLTLGDKTRFKKSRDVGPYLGLVPRQQRSCSIDPQLRISKTGNKLVRRLLVGSAHYVLGRFGPDTDLRRWGLTIAKRGGKNGKKRAVVGVARRLAVLMHRLWTSGEAYEPLRIAKSRGEANGVDET